jgi:CRP-like cAMP-binding protein
MVQAGKLTRENSVDFSAGDNIITQGDEGDYYYILDSGSADAMLSKPKGNSSYTP